MGIAAAAEGAPWRPFHPHLLPLHHPRPEDGRLDSPGHPEQKWPKKGGKLFLLWNRLRLFGFKERPHRKFSRSSFASTCLLSFQNLILLTGKHVCQFEGRSFAPVQRVWGVAWAKWPAIGALGSVWQFIFTPHYAAIHYSRFPQFGTTFPHPTPPPGRCCKDNVLWKLGQRTLKRTRPPEQVRRRHTEVAESSRIIIAPTRSRGSWYFELKCTHYAGASILSIGVGMALNTAIYSKPQLALVSRR